MLTIDTRELRGLGRSFHNAPPLIQREFLLEMQGTARALETAYKRLGRPHYDTGAFDASISADRIDAWSWSIGSILEYAIYLELGTAPHLIPLSPKGPGSVPRFLVFYWPAVGGTIFAEQVSHPGTKALNLLFKAYVQEMEPFDSTFGARLEKRLRILMELR